MADFNRFERMLARGLGRYPHLHGEAKLTYQSLNYWIFGDRGFRLALHPQVDLFTPEQWIGKGLGESENLFFGYYDKSPWSSDMSQAILHRSKTGSKVEILLYDKSDQSIRVVGESFTWNFQQGSMVQWLPSDDTRCIVYNDFVDGNLVARIVSLETNAQTVIPWPIQVVHPNGSEALTLNYCRLGRIRPAYGYSVAVNNFSATQPLERDGIWQIDLDSGRGELILSLKDLISHKPRSEMDNSDHKVNHLMYSPRGSRFVFVHRWIGALGKFSRLYVANADGSGLKLLLDHRMVSHYSWRDEGHILVWARTEEAGDHYYLINVLTGQWRIVGRGVLDNYGDGHPSFSPNRGWIITDTYPDRARKQHLLLYEVDADRVIELGGFFAPLEFTGPSRCDLHPRWSPDERMISIDSAHEGKRRTYILDISAIVESA